MRRVLRLVSVDKLLSCQGALPVLWQTRADDHCDAASWIDNEKSHCLDLEGRRQIGGTFHVVHLDATANTANYARSDQDDGDLKTIAGIVAGMNHFPSDAEKATLTAIVDSSERRGVQMIASAVLNIQHAANAEGKETMGQIIAFDGAPANVKALAEVVMGFSHMESVAAKATLADL